MNFSNRQAKTLKDALHDAIRLHKSNGGKIPEQRSEPSMLAVSGHKFSFLGKRIIVAAEANKNQRIDVAAIKTLTSEDSVVCKPNFPSEISFSPTCSLSLQTSNIPTSLASEFPLIERLKRLSQAGADGS